MEVPFVDLSLQYASLQPELNDTLIKTASEVHYVLGPRLKKFESDYAEFCGSSYCVGVGNGLDALVLSLRACGVGPGDEVIVPAHTFVATALAVSAVGATISLVDVDAKTHSISIPGIGQALNSKVKAIIPVHLYGNPVSMDGINDLVKNRGIYVIEDNAQAQGATFQGKRTGSLGHLAATSFYPTKNLGCMGDGGAVTTNDANLAEKISLLRNYGQRKKYDHAKSGVNSRLDEIQAAVLSVKLKRLSEWNEKRRAIAQKYRELLKSHLEIPEETKDAESVYHLFTVQHEKRDQLSSILTELRIGNLVHYPKAVHQHEAFFEMPHCLSAPLTVSEKICKTTLSLPIFPEMTFEQVDFVAEKVLIACKKL